MVAGLISASCASSPENISASYVSPIIYDNLTCDQLREEATRLSARAGELTGQQNEEQTRDAVATGVAIVVFWPAAFFVGGDGQTAAELARVKGDLEAIKAVSDRKKCGIVFQEPQAPKRSSAPAPGARP